MQAEVGMELKCEGCRIATQLKELQKEFEATRELLRQVAAAQLKTQAQIENGLIEDNDQWESIRALEDGQDELIEFRQKVLDFHTTMNLHGRLEKVETHIVQQKNK
jgi:hypothetical protein